MTKSTQETLGKSVFKIVARDAWEEASRLGSYAGSSVDVRDGFIHLSAYHQLEETAAKHFSGQDDLLLIAFDADALGDALKWEPSRGGDLFPHLYAPLPAARALWTKPLPLGTDGVPILPEGMLPC
jgi:uncharacterized protein (DUF952 family)